MGNNQIKEAKKHNHNLSQVIDYIATNYILTQNFVDMKNLEKKEFSVMQRTKIYSMILRRFFNEV